MLVDSDRSACSWMPRQVIMKGSATTFWSAAADGGDVDKGGVGALLAVRDPATRAIYSNTGTNGAFEAFNTANFDADALGLTSDAELYGLLGASTQAAANKQIDWARGYDAYDKDGDSITNESRKLDSGRYAAQPALSAQLRCQRQFYNIQPRFEVVGGF